MSQQSASKRPKITPFLWYNTELGAAIDLYTSIFPDATVGEKTYNADGKLFTATFSLAGQEFFGLNGGPEFKFNEAFSLFVTCEDQDEIDKYWEALLKDGGQEIECGWLKDKFGLCWQIAHKDLLAYINSEDKQAGERAKKKMFEQKKIIIADIEKAWKGE
ncbi:3-demethylubiquinone-9 3-methyltransferase [Serendipita vermifera]|nr:3-demethylubiquinone-9 3-methyltransferase [Serendipita vermifera]